MINFRKTVATSLAVATFLLSVAATGSQASARPYFHHRIWGWGLGAAAAGVALGAAAAAASAPYYYGYPCLASRPVFDMYGNVIGYRRVYAC